MLRPSERVGGQLAVMMSGKAAGKYRLPAGELK
jgi:hypothetical protein